MRASTLRIALLVAPLLTAAPQLSAQDSPGTRPNGWLVGLSAGVPGQDGQAVPELLTIGVNWTQLRAGRIGADFSLGTMPRAFSEEFFVLGARGGIALPLALGPNVLLLPSGGVSLLGGAGTAGAAGVAGLNAGMAAVLLAGNGVGLRTGVTWHRFAEDDEPIWLWEVGFVRGPRER